MIQYLRSLVFVGKGPIGNSDPGVVIAEGSADNDILFEVLLSYESSPGTLFFLGYTREMEDARRFGFENVQPTADGLFAKLSYRLRF